MNPTSSYLERTEKLYDNNENGYIKEFDANVLSCEEKGNAYYLELDRTAFFPEGGGQPSDIGFIDDGEVCDVQIEDGKILHKVNKPFEIGSHVHGKIDFDLRFKRMQNHSGEHIVSGLIHSLYGFENVGFHMSECEMTVDTSSFLTDEMVEKVEMLANKAVWENRKIRTYYPSEKELETLEYRSKTELSGKIRIADIDGIDKCACCAPHLRTTGEIGLIHIKSHMKYKRGTRLFLVCGLDALNNHLMIAKQNTKISHMLSVDSENVYDAVLKQNDVINEKSKEIHNLKEKLIDFRLSTIERTDKNICVFESDFDAGLLRKLMNGGVKLTDGLFATFSNRKEGGYIYSVGIKEGDLSNLAKLMKEKLSGFGGGKGTMITGFVQSDEQTIRKFFEDLKEYN